MAATFTQTVYPERRAGADTGRWVVLLRATDPVTGHRHTHKRAFTRKAEARAHLNQMIARWQTDGIFLTRGTLAEWAAKWRQTMTESGKWTPATQHAYGCALDLHILPGLGGRMLTGLDHDAIQGWITGLATKSRSDGSEGLLSGSYIASIVSCLKSCLEHAVRARKIPYNPAHYVVLPESSPTERRPLTAAETKRVLHALRFSQDRLASMWAVALTTGARRGELVGLTWDRIDLTTGVLTLDRQVVPVTGRGLILRARLKGGGAGRGGNPRTVQVPKPVLRMLTDHAQGQAQRKILYGARWVGWQVDLVWTTRFGTPVHPRDVTKAWSVMLADMGVEHTPLHAARHTANTRLVDAGVDPATREMLLGHTGPTTNRVYSHLTAEQLGKAAAAMGALYGSG